MAVVAAEVDVGERRALSVMVEMVGLAPNVYEHFSKLLALVRANQ